jgi:VanZ family protein
VNLRDLLHQLRRLDVWLIPPAFLVVIAGELVHSPVLGRLEAHVWDKALHFTAYFGLALMTTVAVRADRRSLWWMLALIAMGGALEIIQGMTGRDADIYDELANTLGAVTGMALGFIGIALLKRWRILEDKTPPGVPPNV